MPGVDPSTSTAALGTLAAVATIRTALNFFLAKEMKEARTLVTGDGARSSTSPAISEVPASGRRIVEGRTA
jgi:hypothetical protein